jgi:hypothetical protein
MNTKIIGKEEGDKKKEMGTGQGQGKGRKVWDKDKKEVRNEELCGM